MVNEDNPCSECVKTNNHCCTTDLVLNMADAIIMRRKAKELGKDTVIGFHIDSPSDDPTTNMLMMIPNKRDMDPRREPCVFFDKDGKCEIYEDRPSICRTYGTQDMHCRFTYAGISTEKQIAACTKKDIRELDIAAMDGAFDVIGNLVTFR